MTERALVQRHKNGRARLRKKIYKGIVLLLIVGVLALFIMRLTTPPPTFDQSMSLEILSGMSVRDIATKASMEGIVRSEFFLYAILTYAHDPTNIYAGTYVFEQPSSVFQVAQKLANNDIENNLLRITIPEGVSVQMISAIVADVLPNFDTEKYISLATPYEGYLFPETYFIPEDYTATDLFALQRQTFDENILSLRDKISSNGLSELEILTLASIVEKEANDVTSMKMVAGVLQNRLAIDMPLQADATIQYILNTPLGSLPEGELAKQLKETDSLYNTYFYKGLPPTPIGNPGITAIQAVLEPTLSDYFYYITDNEGVFHYAKTLTQHNQNIAKYLR